MGPFFQDAYDKVLVHIRRTGYGRNVEESIAGNLIRVLDWLSDSKEVVALPELRTAKERLRHVTHYFTNFLTDLSNRLSLEQGSAEFNLVWAKFHQQLAADYLVAFSNNDPTFQKGLETFAQFVQQMSQRGEKAFIFAHQAINGAKAQAALMKHFTENGWLTVAPDPQNDEEIKIWDVMHGVDYVVIDEQGRVRFIDAKSRHYLEGRSTEYGARTSPREAHPYDRNLLYNWLLPSLKALPPHLQQKYQAHLKALTYNSATQNIDLQRYVIYVQPSAINSTNGKLSYLAATEVKKL